MDYARNVLSLPVPRVRAWSARSEKTTNPVGAEFILMEKVEGDLLYTRWWSDKSVNLKQIMEDIAVMENRFVSHSFSHIGSLYYKEDLPPDLQERPLYSPQSKPDGDAHERFRIGPLVDWTVWRGSRAVLDVDRGPCKL